MTPRITEDTKISLGVVLLTVGILTGGIVWLTSIAIQTSANADAIRRTESKQESYADSMEALKLDQVQIHGELTGIHGELTGIRGELKRIHGGR